MVVLFVSMTAINAVQDNVAAGKASIQLQSIGELSEMAQKMAEQYQLEHADVKIDVATIPSDGIDEFLNAGGILLANKDCLFPTTGDQGLRMVVGRDVIVPVMNISNPQKDIILQKGISPQQFNSIYKSAGEITWGALLGTSDKEKVEAFVPGNSCAKGYLSDFMGTNPNEINATEVSSPEAMLGRIEANPNAIGFCTLACLVELEGTERLAGISLVPIDRDGDGSLEPLEDIYGSFAQLSHGIFVGKYPRELFSRVYALTAHRTATSEEVAFLDWMINDGQKSLATAGILTIDYGERASGLRELYPAPKVLADVPVGANSARIITVSLVALVLLSILVLLITGRLGKKPRKSSGTGSPVRSGSYGSNAASFPAGMFFDRSHTWAFMERSGHVRIGLDDFIQRVTGSLTRVVMKSPGERIKRGETFLTINQHGKKLEIKSPLTGVVVEHNETLSGDASVINRDPYNEGWIYMIEPLNWMSESKSFFMGEPYGVWLKTELSRLKDFFAGVFKINDPHIVLPVLQDGGEIMDASLEELGPEHWEDFQTRFINRK